jgi:hypothetical protein
MKSVVDQPARLQIAIHCPDELHTKKTTIDHSNLKRLNLLFRVQKNLEAISTKKEISFQKLILVGIGTPSVISLAQSLIGRLHFTNIFTAYLLSH